MQGDEPVVCDDAPSNPVAAPPAPASAADLPPGVTIIPMYPLYSPGQVTAAAFLGGPLASAWLMAINYRRLGAPTKAIATVVIAAVALLALIWIESIANFPGGLNIAVPLAVVAIHRSLQGAAYRSHIERQGRVASSWRAFGVIIAMLVATLALAVPFTLGLWTSSFKAGNCEVVYEDGATVDEARALCKELTAIQFIGTNRATVGLAHAKDRAIVQLVVQDFALGDRRVANEIHGFSAALSKTVFHGAPVDIWLDNSHFEPKMKLIWEARPE